MTPLVFVKETNFSTPIRIPMSVDRAHLDSRYAIRNDNLDAILIEHLAGSVLAISLIRTHLTSLLQARARIGLRNAIRRVILAQANDLLACALPSRSQ